MLAFAVFVAMAVGLLGTLVPGLPGLVIIFAAAIVYGVIDGFGPLGTAVVVVMLALLVVGSLASYVLPHRAGVLAGVGRTSLRLGIVGAVVGFFVIPVLGLPIGAVLGVLIGEQHRLGDVSRAWATTWRVVVGFGLGALAEIGSGVLMVLAWVAWWVWG